MKVTMLSRILRHGKLFLQKLRGVLAGRYACNICQRSFDSFLASYSTPPRASSCPFCSSDERTRHLYIYLLALYQKLENKKILHIAPELQLQRFLKASGAEYVDCDLSRTDVSCREDITHLSFSDNTFDYTICMHILEHVLDDQQAISELYRVLKPGGMAIVAVPLAATAMEDYTITSPDARKAAYGERDHVRNYSHDLLESKLHKSGFTVTFSSPEAFPEAVVTRYNLGTSMGAAGSRLFFCIK